MFNSISVLMLPFSFFSVSGMYNPSISIMAELLIGDINSGVNPLDTPCPLSGKIVSTSISCFHILVLSGYSCGRFLTANPSLGGIELELDRTEVRVAKTSKEMVWVDRNSRPSSSNMER